MTGAPVLQVRSRADLYDAIALYEQVGAQHRIPLLRALLNGRIAYFECQRSTSVGAVKRFFGMVEKPAVMLLADDDYASTGPDGFAVTDRALQWARLAVIHGTGGTPEQYAELVEAAGLARRLVLVETDSAHAGEWVARGKAHPNRPRLILLRPIGDRQHPTVPAVRQ
jgi:hypothetical protein